MEMFPALQESADGLALVMLVVIFLELWDMGGTEGCGLRKRPLLVPVG
jgi:hypothetical protein